MHRTYTLSMIKIAPFLEPGLTGGKVEILGTQLKWSSREARSGKIIMVNHWV